MCITMNPTALPPVENVRRYQGLSTSIFVRQFHFSHDIPFLNVPALYI